MRSNNKINGTLLATKGNASLSCYYAFIDYFSITVSDELETN